MYEKITKEGCFLIIFAVVAAIAILCALILPNIRMFQPWMFGAF